MLFISFSGFAEICSDYSIEVEEGFSWSETDFTKSKASTTLKSFQKYIDNGQEPSMAFLHNGLILIEGYILKQSATDALAAENAPNIIKAMKVQGFCEFLGRSAIYD